MKLLFIAINAVVLTTSSGAMRLRPRDQMPIENAIESSATDRLNETYNSLAHRNDLPVDKFSFKNILKFFKGDLSQDDGTSKNEQEENTEVELVKELLENYEADIQEDSFQPEGYISGDDELQFEQGNVENDFPSELQVLEDEEDVYPEGNESQDADSQELDNTDDATTISESNEVDESQFLENWEEFASEDADADVAEPSTDEPSDYEEADDASDISGVSDEGVQENDQEKAATPKESKSNAGSKKSRKSKLKKPLSKVSNNLKNSDSLQNLLNHLNLVKDMISRKRANQMNSSEIADSYFLYNQLTGPTLDRMEFYERLKTDKRLRSYIKENIKNLGVAEKLLHKNQLSPFSDSAEQDSEDSLIQAASVVQPYGFGDTAARDIVTESSIKKNKGKKDARKVADKKDSNKKFEYSDPENMYETSYQMQYTGELTNASYYGNLSAPSANATSNSTSQGSDCIPDVYGNTAVTSRVPQFLGVMAALLTSALILY